MFSCAKQATARRQEHGSFVVRHSGKLVSNEKNQNYIHR